MIERRSAVVGVAALLGLGWCLAAWLAAATRVDPGDARAALPWVVSVPIVAGLTLAIAARGRGREARLALGIVTLLLAIGEAMLLTIGVDGFARGKHDEPFRLAIRHAPTCWVACAALVVAASPWFAKGVERWSRRPWTLSLVCAGLVAGTTLFGAEMHGRRLWIHWNGVSLQPVEAVKVAFVLILAGALAHRAELLGDRRHRGGRAGLPSPRHLGPLVVCIGTVLVPLFAQGDLGPLLLLCVVAVAMFVLAGGSRRLAIAATAALATVACVSYVAGVPHIVRVRADMWLAPFERCEAVVRGLWAFAAGGWTGAGHVAARPAEIPVVASDFNYAALVEVAGAVGGLAVILLYAALGWLGLQLAGRARSPERRLASCGIALLVALQAALIVGGNLGMLPLTGITLPWVSLGGSALVAQALGLGFVLGGEEAEVVGAAERDEPLPRTAARRRAALVLTTLFGALALGTLHRTVWASDRIAATPFHDVAAARRAQRLVDADPRTLLPDDRQRLTRLRPYLEPAGERWVVPETVFRVANPRGYASLSDGLTGRILDRNGRVLAGPDPDDPAVRVYPAGEAAFAVVGHRNAAYGLRGMEAATDPWLRGARQSGLFRTLRDGLRRDDPGDDVVLTIDARVQRAAYRALGEREGAIAVVRIADGEIVALASAPSLAPSTPPGPAWAKAARSGRHGPFVHHAVQRRYPPGSAFKIVLEAIWLETHDGQAPAIDCDGRHDASRVRDLGRTAHGAGLSIDDALARSCNVYFAELAARLGPALAVEAGRFGFNRELAPTDGFPLQMAPGLALARPGADSEWWTPDAIWCARNPGLVGQAGVGQNLVEVSPLHMAMVVTALARDGEWIDPTLVREARRRTAGAEPGAVAWYDRTRIGTPERHRAVSRATARRVMDGMRAVVREGTARAVLDAAFEIGGKTGTAQTGNLDGRADGSHAWFVGFAPADDPKFAIAVLVENGGSGAIVAAPLARDVLRVAVDLESGDGRPM